MTTNKTLANRLIAQGFDGTYIRNGSVHVLCSQCEALVLNGCATHEHGCLNTRHECRGCNEQIAIGQKYCQDCR